MSPDFNPFPRLKEPLSGVGISLFRKVECSHDRHQLNSGGQLHGIQKLSEVRKLFLRRERGNFEGF
jgi:hypothetical protein